ncbi:MAG: hypothetical protein RL292_405 [Candidatus Parcubacteria bacterium]|jgi:tryptophan-rich sensory protein
MNTFNSFSQLIKPSWAPPSWIFGPVWTVLYALIALTYGTVFYHVYTGKVKWVVALPFVLNLIFNAAFTPLQFGLKNNLLASIDIILILITLVWALVILWYRVPEMKWIVYTNIPYLLWVSFATTVQLAITVINR